MKTTNNRKYNLAERTAIFSQEIIQFIQKIPFHPLVSPLTNQLIRSATSIGANYCEADDASSKKEFKHKIGICKKEARETKYWLNLISIACPNSKSNIDKLWIEAKELHLIFSKIFNSTHP